MSKEYAPSPWGKQPSVLKEEHAFKSEAFPVNSIPFLTRLREVLDEAQTNSLQTVAKLPIGTVSEQYYWKARALLWVINGQFFGQLADINMSKEWDELNRAHNEGKF